MSNNAKLKSLFRSGRTTIAMGAYDPLSARLVERAGYDLVYLGGYAAAAAMLGLPDLGMMTATEVADHIRRVRAVTTVPILVDADNGHGSALNTARTIAEFLAAGASGVHMEDQVLPKKCGHMGGKRLVPVRDMISKIRAAREAGGEEFALIARTDAIAIDGTDAAIERAARYAEAGADALFLDAPESMAHVEQIGRDLGPLGVPLVFNAASTGKTPTLAVKEIEALGFNVILYPIEAMLAALAGARLVMDTLKVEGSLEGIRDRMASFADMQDLLGVAKMEALDERFPTS
ncbi:isocitrate lyase/PEP mutase family protein [Oricola thermophila]|uniref:Oxaloacetate decarboxylase n=1 Tax=Oricola thermophila TaxID=2742145 RepID=A0A6N1VCF3_9HYPH|nr:oxaloacetate decarboxylase [Oricola thermophila]QKV18550.1 oxaloacetate decarboxylase [Oricola thermophila]